MAAQFNPKWIYLRRKTTWRNEKAFFCHPHMGTNMRVFDFFDWFRVYLSKTGLEKMWIINLFETENDRNDKAFFATHTWTQIWECKSAKKSRPNMPWSSMNAIFIKFWCLFIWHVSFQRSTVYGESWIKHSWKCNTFAPNIAKINFIHGPDCNSSSLPQKPITRVQSCTVPLAFQITLQPINLLDRSCWAGLNPVLYFWTFYIPLTRI